ncbi:UDP-glucose 6-dehydrogenase [Psittacicella melopsittaci]|uniref:UDP-glucose 6-dehydrogenase n=1 Tax=Psittacicella melopsittaci TaxID=2028576 RepID=A0A3A1Y7R4_9GAMM|nr:nucleotide sugar dehydrogenase [Psittacicella melopsittaci]RIY33665.1 UDP-glucose 6-dehydrogenase [Psittacicella melopsittaci]
MKKIAVIGAGYVGLSNACILAQKNQVTLLEINPEKVAKIEAKQAPIQEHAIAEFLGETELQLSATTEAEQALTGVDYVVIATPTNYDPVENYFDTESVEQSIAQTLRYSPQATIIIKSTIPIGFSNSMRERFATESIYFSPEFLREGHSLYDNLYPSRIIVGGTSEQAATFAQLLKEASAKEEVEIILTGNTEAEAIKLFANTYLAMRVAYFNEIDTYASVYNLDINQIIRGVGLDPRIGLHYNNPSFGYGGYCLPKDTKQLLANYKNIEEQSLIGAIVEANDHRKDFIAKSILATGAKVVGVYRLIMKAGSDNFRDAAVLGVIERLQAQGVKVIVYEPMLEKSQILEQVTVVNDFATFAQLSDLIIANRSDSKLSPYASKVYSRDLSGTDD